MYGIQLPNGVPAQDPANGTNLTVSAAGLLQLSIGGAAPKSVGAPPGWSEVTGASAVQNIDIPVDSANQNGWELFGLLDQSSAGTDVDVYLQPAANNSGLAVGGILSGVGGSSSGLVTADTVNATPDTTKLIITRGGGQPGRLYSYIHARLLWKDGFGGFFVCDTVQAPTSGAMTGTGAIYRVSQAWTGTDSAFTVLRVRANSASGISAYNLFYRVI